MSTTIISEQPIDFKMLSRPLNEDEIDFRIQSINRGKYATILAYKDARVDMNILDEVVGACNWQKDYKVINGELYCGIGIFNGTEWVWKWDVGTKSDVEKEKGQASDAFKRSAFNWGIGRELYSFPQISVLCNEGEYEEKNGKFYPTFKFNPKAWKWTMTRDENGVLTSLTGNDGKSNRFTWKSGTFAAKQDVNAPIESKPTPSPTSVTPSNTPSTEKPSDKDRAKAKTLWDGLKGTHTAQLLQIAKQMRFSETRNIDHLNKAEVDLLIGMLQAIKTAEPLTN